MKPTASERVPGRARLQEIGRELGRDARDGDIIALYGPKRVGKTVLARAIVEALGVKESFSPSSFVIRQTYRTGRTLVHHLDLYKVAGTYEFCSAGMDQWLEVPGVTIIEWADRIERLLPEQTIRVEIDFGERLDERVISITHHAQDTPETSREELTT